MNINFFMKNQLINYYFLGITYLKRENVQFHFSEYETKNIYLLHSRFIRVIIIIIKKSILHLKLKHL